jgi:hypothetical protein
MSIATSVLARICIAIVKELRQHGAATLEARKAFETANPREGRTIQPEERRTGWTMSEFALPLAHSNISLDEMLMVEFSDEYVAAGSGMALVDAVAEAFPDKLHVVKTDRLRSDGRIVKSIKVATGPARPSGAA